MSLGTKYIANATQMAVLLSNPLSRAHYGLSWFHDDVLPQCLQVYSFMESMLRKLGFGAY